MIILVVTNIILNISRILDLNTEKNIFAIENKEFSDFKDCLQENVR